MGAEMKRPAAGDGGAWSLEAGRRSEADTSRIPKHIQGAARVIGLGLHHLPSYKAMAMILDARLPRERRLWLAAAALRSLDAETAEELAEVTLRDLRAGPPLPAFYSIKAEAESWAEFASPAEVKHYLIAAWNALPTEDRKRFLRVAV